MYKISKQRKHARIEKPYITTYRVKPSDGMDSKDWDMVAVVNLSAGGILFHAHQLKLKVDTILDLKIGFSLTHPSIICVGRIIRVKKHLRTSIASFAIQFTEIDKHIVEAINDTVVANVK
ncbi:MAG: PilZ domain-containing protein [Candidatus Brocadiaceae bacterium]|nr:PilZ domain-containing protein [Candidatus Brocadiaceae bacterium]